MSLNQNNIECAGTIVLSGRCQRKANTKNQDAMKYRRQKKVIPRRSLSVIFGGLAVCFICSVSEEAYLVSDYSGSLRTMLKSALSSM